MELVKNFGSMWRGILFAFVISVPAWLLGKQFEVIGGPVFAILFGMILALVVSDKKAKPLQARQLPLLQKKYCNGLSFFWDFGLNLAQICSGGSHFVAHLSYLR